jgi:hypothetical protein
MNCSKTFQWHTSIQKIQNCQCMLVHGSSSLHSHHNFVVHDMETHAQALLTQACNWGWRDVRRIMHSGNHNRGFSHTDSLAILSRLIRASHDLGGNSEPLSDVHHMHNVAIIRSHSQHRSISAGFGSRAHRFTPDAAPDFRIPSVSAGPSALDSDARSSMSASCHVPSTGY